MAFYFFPEFKPSHDKQSASVWSELQGQALGIPQILNPTPPQVRKPYNQKTRLDPSLPERSRSFALAAVFGFRFTFEKLQGHFMKLGN